MDIQFKVTTPGSHLSVESLSRITNSLETIVRDSVLESVMQVAQASGKKPDRSSVGRIISKERKCENAGLFIEDVRKGSWEFIVVGAVISLMSKTLYELGIDYVKQHPNYQDMVKWLNDKTTKPCKTAIEEKVGRLDEIGTLRVTDRRVISVTKTDGFEKIEVELLLSRTAETELSITSKEQLKSHLKDLGIDPDKQL